jgi:hypothetical protein
VAAALVYREEFCIATTLRVASMLLLEIESRPWRGLTQRNPPEEILMLPKFLLPTRLILPGPAQLGIPLVSPQHGQDLAAGW